MTVKGLGGGFRVQPINFVQGALLTYLCLVPHSWRTFPAASRTLHPWPCPASWRLRSRAWPGADPPAAAVSQSSSSVGTAGGTIGIRRRTAGTSLHCHWYCQQLSHTTASCRRSCYCQLPSPANGLYHLADFNSFYPSQQLVKWQRILISTVRSWKSFPPRQQNLYTAGRYVSVLAL